MDSVNNMNIDFAALGLLEGAPNEIATAVVETAPTLEERVARLEVKGIDETTLCQMFQLSAVALEEMRQSETYAQALAQGQQQQVETPVHIDDNWDGVENTALTRLRTTVADEYDPDRLLKIASVANRATRRNERGANGRGQLNANDAVSKVVQVNFSPTFIKQLNSINPVKEHARVAELAKERNMVDFLPQGEFETLMNENVKDNTVDELEQAVAFLDRMVIGA